MKKLMDTPSAPKILSEAFTSLRLVPNFIFSSYKKLTRKEIEVLLENYQAKKAVFIFN